MERASLAVADYLRFKGIPNVFGLSANGVAPEGALISNLYSKAV